MHNWLHETCILERPIQKDFINNNSHTVIMKQLLLFSLVSLVSSVSVAVEQERKQKNERSLQQHL